MTHVLKYYKNAVYHFEFLRDVYKSYIKSMNFPKKDPLSVMDIGCGDGKILFDVLNPSLPKNCSELVGIDVDNSMIEHCQSLKKDSKISFQHMDIASGEVPAKFEGHFDLLFSSYCFTYVKNLRQGLANSHRLLKPNGELLFIFMYKKNQLYTTYREMGKIDVWKSYMTEYTNFVPHFSDPEPKSQMTHYFEDAGFQVLNHEFQQNVYFESTGGHFIEVYKSLDKIYQHIPENKRQKYMEDFDRIFCSETGIDWTDKRLTEGMLKMNFPTVIVHAKKSKTRY